MDFVATAPEVTSAGLWNLWCDGEGGKGRAGGGGHKQETTIHVRRALRGLTNSQTRFGGGGLRFCGGYHRQANDMREYRDKML